MPPPLPRRVGVAIGGNDWSLTTWEGSRRAQLHRALSLTLRERMEPVAGTREGPAIAEARCGRPC